MVVKQVEQLKKRAAGVFMHSALILGMCMNAKAILLLINGEKWHTKERKNIAEQKNNY